MTCLLKRIFTALLLPAACALGAQAQLLLPSSHNNQHTDLLALQPSLTNQFRIENNNRLMKDVLDRESEGLDFADDDLFEAFWGSDRVNCYQDAAIPAHASIDVSDFVMPLKEVTVTSNYGYRPRFRRMHYGTDLSLRVGDTVYAAFTGKVRLTKFERSGYGYYVVIRHTNGMETVYGHLSRFLVKPDQWVTAGEPIALGGNTGRSTGPHLHLETRYMGMPINPAAIIDFDNGTTHSDVFAFNKATAGKSQQNYASGKRAPKRKAATTASKKKKKAKARASSKKKRR